MASFVLGLLLTALFAVYRIGTSAWQKVDVRADLLGQFHLVSARISTAGGRTPPAGVTISPDGAAVAVLSPLLDDGTFALDTSTNVLTYQRHTVFWFDVASLQIRQGDVLLAAPTPTVTPIDSLDPNWHLNLPTDFSVLARDVIDFEVTWWATDPAVLQIVSEGARRRYGRQDHERVRLRTLVKVGPP